MKIIKFSGIGSYIPERRITNQHWENLVETSDSWIQKNLGIRERSRIEPENTTTTMAVKAVEIALEMAGVNAREVDFIICATNTQDDLYPSTASKIQGLINAAGATSLDLQAGCTGWLYGMRMSAALLLAGQGENALIIGTDALSRALNFYDRSSTLFGDGAGAAFLQIAETEKDAKLPAPLFYTQTTPSRSMAQPTIISEEQNRLEDYLAKKDMRMVERPLPSMQGKEALKLALAKSREMLDGLANLMAGSGFTFQDIDMFVPHQTNIHVVKALCEHTGFPFERIPFTLEKYGGISTAGIPTGIYEHLKAGHIEPGDLILCVGYGAGFTAGAMLIESDLRI